MFEGRFKDRMTRAMPGLSPAEQRMARTIAQRMDRVVLGSAVQIAALAGASDATLLRTVRSLGYQTLAGLREDLLAELTGAAAPSRRMEKTLDDAGKDPSRALAHMVEVQHGMLAGFHRPEMNAAFTVALGILGNAPFRHVFGIGPSGALADYLSLQMGRIGLRSLALTRTGVALADQLLAIGPGDAVVIIAYAPLYREVRSLIDRAAAIGARVVLVSDSLAAVVGDQVDCTLPVPRGRSEHLALHSATMVMIEALVLGLAARDRDRALAALDDFSTLRAAIDGEWRKRGTRRRKAPVPDAVQASPDPQPST